MAAADVLEAPFSAFRFDVELTVRSALRGIGSPVCRGAFAECDGIEIAIEPKTMTPGGYTTRQSHRVGPPKFGQITLRRGMDSAHDLWAWMSAATVPGRDLRADGRIALQSPAGEVNAVFVVEGCLPVRAKGPSLHAQNGQIAMEELGLAVERLYLDGTLSVGRGAYRRRRVGGLVSVVRPVGRRERRRERHRRASSERWGGTVGFPRWCGLRVGGDRLMASTMTLTDQSGSLSITADFNPQSLSLTHSTSLVNQGQPKTGTQSSPAQVTGYQTALSFDLQFDTTLTGDDVRNTTERLVQLSRPDKAEARNVTVSWGTFPIHRTDPGHHRVGGLLLSRRCAAPCCRQGADEPDWQGDTPRDVG